ncbi:nucleotide-binding alpha-beta plait domain-containing protein [Artemisia annua]|uniref:Nucleotide-binding alpha-beta plait domain-containing protein n=1 Tax=Artemisia annua TaxID=35608 RepID=A0A2U1Q301_ARTAN|nr:nucleotide-binding alpha-beta plait domain-containing protein [Artemisia annua]
MDHLRRRRVPIPENTQRRITKIFVTNLPEGCSGTGLATQVRMYGQIFGLYIARKRDKGGNRFGFVSMLDVKDKEELLKNLRGIRMGDCKLWFNIARFVLEDGEINSGGDNHIPDMHNKMKNKDGASNFRATTGGTGTGSQSFRDLLAGKSIDIDSNVNAFSAVHERALVARMVNVDALKNIYVTLKSICSGYGNVQYLGGLDVLVTFEDSETALAFRDVAISMKERFSDIIVWRGQSLSSERLAWIKVQGIPLHLLSNQVIDMIGSTVGKVVHKGNMEETDPDLSFAYVAILVGDGKRISEDITLNWKNRKFRISVTEELGDWVPDFVTVNEARETEDSEDDVMAEEHGGFPEDEETPDNQSEKSPVNHDDVIADGKLTRNVTVEGTVNVIDDSQSLAFKENNSNVSKVMGDFIPAVNFDFEQSFGNTQNSPSNSKVAKRKKFKKS